MDLDIILTRYGSQGGSPIVGGLCSILMQALCVEDVGIRELVIDLNYPSPAGNRATEYVRYLASMPKVTWHKGRRRLTILLAPSENDYNKVGGSGDPVACADPARYASLGKHVLAALRVAERRFEKDPTVALDRLVARTEQTLSELPEAHEALAERVRGALAWVAATTAAEVAADPFAGLEVDWAHPRAREILPEPWFWDPTEELGPVGSDTGDDVLAAYRSFRRRGGEPSGGLELLRGLLRSWAVPDPAGVEIAADAIIALAFSQIMVDGVVENDVREGALAAIDDQRPEADRLQGRAAALERMKRLLLSVA